MTVEQPRWHDFETEVWRLYFGVLKGTLLTVICLACFVAIGILFFTQWVAVGATRAAEWVFAWQPSKPSIFESGD